MEKLTTDKLKTMQNDGEDMEIINVLSKEKFNELHIPGSVSVPLDEMGFVEAVQNVVGDMNRKVVVYCASHECDMSTKAALRLEDSGFRHVYEYTGGMKDWSDAGLPTEGAKAELQGASRK